MEQSLNGILDMMRKIDSTYSEFLLLEDIAREYENGEDNDNFGVSDGILNKDNYYNKKVSYRNFGDDNNDYSDYEDVPGIDTSYKDDYKEKLKKATDGKTHNIDFNVNKRTVKRIDSIPTDDEGEVDANIPSLRANIPQLTAPITGEKYQNKELEKSEDVDLAFMQSEYTDDATNLQKVISYFETTNKQLKAKEVLRQTHLMLGDTPDKGEEWNLSINNDGSPLSYINGFASESEQTNIDNAAVNVALKTLVSQLKLHNGLKITNVEQFAEALKNKIGINTPELVNDLKANRAIDFSNFDNNKKKLSVLHDKLKKFISAVMNGEFGNETIRINVERYLVATGAVDTIGQAIDKLSDFDVEDIKVENDGKITNAMAYYFARGFDKDSDERAVGLLSMLPPSYDILRSVSYVSHKIKNIQGGIDNYRFARNLLFKSAKISSATMRIRYGKVSEVIQYNPFYDDPINHMEIEELIGNATSILMRVLDEHIQSGELDNHKMYDIKDVITKISLTDESGSRSFEGKGKTKTTGYYSIMDYVFSLLTVLTNESRYTGFYGSGFSVLFKTKLKDLYKTIDSVIRQSGGSSLLKAFPLSVIVDKSIDAQKYFMETFEDASLDESVKVQLKLLKDIIGGKKFENNPLYVYTDRGRRPLSVAEVFSRLLGDNRLTMQDKVLWSVDDAFNNNESEIHKALSDWNVEVGEELNRPGFVADDEIADLIGNKSVDIFVRANRGEENVNIAIEYQGEQHYFPNCAKGFRSDDDTTRVDRLRGRSDKRTLKSLAGYNGPQNVFIAKQTFPERMSSLMEEVIAFSLKENNLTDPKSLTRTNLKDSCWNYLTSLIDQGVIDNDGITNGKSSEAANHYTAALDANSRKRWYEEFSLYLQQAADKQKFIKLTNAGWHFFHVCPPGNVVHKDLVKQAGEIPYITDFSDLAKRVADAGWDEEDFYVNSSKGGRNYGVVAEMVHKLENPTRPENNPAMFTYKFSEKPMSQYKHYDPYHNDESTFGEAIMNCFSRKEKENGEL